jgi:hypothetical protein
MEIARRLTRDKRAPQPQLKREWSRLAAFARTNDSMTKCRLVHSSRKSQREPLTAVKASVLPSSKVLTPL